MPTSGGAKLDCTPARHSSGRRTYAPQHVAHASTFTGRHRSRTATLDVRKRGRRQPYANLKHNAHLPARQRAFSPPRVTAPPLAFCAPCCCARAAPPVLLHPFRAGVGRWFLLSSFPAALPAGDKGEEGGRRNISKAARNPHHRRRAAWRARDHQHAGCCLCTIICVRRHAFGLRGAYFSARCLFTNDMFTHARYT